MSVFLQPLQTVTVGSGGATSITFSNIPQTFTDLKVVVSARSSNGSFYDNLIFTVNGNTSNYSVTRLFGNGIGSVVSDRFSNQSFIYAGEVTSNTATANTFGPVEIYIPNYTSSNYKQISAENSAETNASSTYYGMHAGLWSNTSAITSISLTCGGNTIQQYSTFALYGILRQGI
jgi:hypothetical protein